MMAPVVDLHQGYLALGATQSFGPTPEGFGAQSLLVCTNPVSSCRLLSTLKPTGAIPLPIGAVVVRSRFFVAIEDLLSSLSLRLRIAPLTASYKVRLYLTVTLPPSRHYF